jgi:hypothetical protein
MNIKNKKYSGYAISALIYLAFIIASYLIGYRYSCTWVQDVYFWCTLFLLATLFAVPFIFKPELPIALRILLALINTIFGIGVWMWAFDAAHMVLLCSIPM